MSRPPVDLVVPFRGSAEELAALRARLARIRRAPDDTVTVVDNTPGAAAPPPGEIPAIRASGRLTPGYARNRGAELGDAEWIVFLDADTVPSPGLLERYFAPPPGERTGLLAGGVIDEPVGPRGRLAPRYAELRGTLHQARSLGAGRYGFAVAANLACRRAALAAAGGFREDIRAGEDAELNYRLRAAGWGTERREGASVVHRSRGTVRGALAQAALHGSGAAWVDGRYPGAFPRRRLPGLAWWGLRFAARELTAYARTSERDRLVTGVMEPLWELAFEIGRRRPALAHPSDGRERATPGDTLGRR